MGKPRIDVVKLGKRGELALPRRLRASLGLREGDELLVTIEEKRIVLERRARAFRAYLDVMTGREEPVRAGGELGPRRGLGRFLAK